MLLRRLLGAIVLALALTAATEVEAVAVDLELVLLVDVSGSVDPTEFTLQRDAYVAAFEDPALQAAMTAGPVGSIAATVVYWDGSITVDVTDPSTMVTDSFTFPFIEQKVDWTPIASGTDADNFAADIAGTDAIINIVADVPGFGLTPFSNGDPNDPLQGDGATGLASALEFGIDLLLADNGFEGSRLVIDISSDGFENIIFDPAACTPSEDCFVGHQNLGSISDAALYFAAVLAQRDRAELEGVTINALPILTDHPTLQTAVYDPHVVTADGFSIAANDFESFDIALQQKLTQELPEPGSALLLLVGLVAVGAARRA